MNDQVRTPAAPQGFVPYTGDAELDRRLIEVEDALKEPAFERAVELAEALLRDVPGNAVNTSSFGRIATQAGFMRIWQLSFRYRF